MESINIKNLTEKEKKKLKEIKLEDLYRVFNSYIKLDLEVGKIYKVSDIHKIIRNNLQNALKQIIKETDLKILNEIFILDIWKIDLFLHYENITKFVEFGRYSLDWKTRANASWYNDNRKLITLPKFDFEENIKDLKNLKKDNLYDLIVTILNKEKENLITAKLYDIEEYKNKIKEIKKSIKKLIEFNIE